MIPAPYSRDTTSESSIAATIRMQIAADTTRFAFLLLTFFIKVLSSPSLSREPPAVYRERKPVHIGGSV